ncbi:MAG: carbon-nitrogen family hydrolase [Oscillospiraceae bacterium]|nr:carbon-nitrogen family hydrolase [Oscillospiraceae bacterium]
MRVTLVQPEYNDNDDKRIRVEAVRDILMSREMSGEKPDLIMLPEMWSTGFFSFENYIENSEDIYGETMTMLSEAAKCGKCYLFGGTFIEKSGGKYYNTALLFDRKGDIAAVYRKIHLFAGEREYLSRGDKISVAETDIGIMGMSVCYDLRFPELYRKMSERGAQIFAGAAAWPFERKDHLCLLSRARALENQAFLFFCCMAGVNKGVKYSGTSMAVSPTGEVIRTAGEKAQIYTAEAELSECTEYRRKFPVLDDKVIITR